jgi:hypothetical protein
MGTFINGDTCEMCGEVMTTCDHNYCDICPECLEEEK